VTLFFLPREKKKAKEKEEEEETHNAAKKKHAKKKEKYEQRITRRRRGGEEQKPHEERHVASGVPGHSVLKILRPTHSEKPRDCGFDNSEIRGEEHGRRVRDWTRDRELDHEVIGDVQESYRD
jgi:hypothetical protein